MGEQSVHRTGGTHALVRETVEIDRPTLGAEPPRLLRRWCFRYIVRQRVQQSDCFVGAARGARAFDRGAIEKYGSTLATKPPVLLRCWCFRRGVRQNEVESR